MYNYIQSINQSINGHPQKHSDDKSHKLSVNVDYKIILQATDTLEDI